MTAADQAEADDEEDDGEDEEEEGGSQADIDRDIEAGKRIHLLYANQESAEATEPERERAAMARKVDADMYDAWLSYFTHEPAKTITELVEHRWWLLDSEGNKLYSGQTDRVWLRGEIGEPCDILLADLKGLWGRHDPAALNYQIRHYIALIACSAAEFGFTAVRSAMAYLNQPAKTTAPAPALYAADDIDQAVIEMRLEVTAILDPDAPRTPGPTQCFRCKAKLLCQEYQERQAVVLQEVPVAQQMTPKEISQLIAALPAERLAAFLTWGDTLKNAAKLAATEAKRRLNNDPASVPGWRLRKNSPREKVVDLPLVWARLAENHSVTPEEFAALCSITKKNVVDTVRKKTGLRGAVLNDVTSLIFAGAVKPTVVASSLEPITS